MAYRPVPGARGVKMLPGGESDPNVLEQWTDPRTGTNYVRTKKSGWVTALPYAVAAGFAAPYVLPALGASAAASGATGTTAATGGTLASYGATPAMYAAGAGLPTATAGTGAGMAGSGFFNSIGKFFGSPGGAELTRLGGDLFGGYMNNRGANRAADLTANANADTLAWLKQQDAMDRAEYEKERERAWRFEDEDRAHKYKREAEREGRLAPFRQGAERGYQTLSSLLFNPNQPLAVSPAISNAVQRRSLADLMRG